MKVYLVFRDLWDYEARHLEEIFSSKKKAEDYVESQTKKKQLDIEIWEIM